MVAFNNNVKASHGSSENQDVLLQCLSMSTQESPLEVRIYPVTEQFLDSTLAKLSAQLVHVAFESPPEGSGQRKSHEGSCGEVSFRIRRFDEEISSSAEVRYVAIDVLKSGSPIGSAMLDLVAGKLQGLTIPKIEVDLVCEILRSGDSTTINP